MQKTKDFMKKNWKKLVGGAVLLLIVIMIAKGSNGDDNISTATVEKKSIVDSLILNGEAEPSQGAEMSFATSGTVERVYRQPGDTVFSGEKIAELDNGTLRADLADAQASLDLARAEAKVSDAETDRDVANAYAKLLSDDLVAYSKDLSISDNAPDVSGSYTGGKEGEYVINVEYSNNLSRRSFHYSGLEKGDMDIVFYKAVPVGTKGLYLKFEEGTAGIGDTWRISIPNVESASYVENLNNYKSALASRDAAESDNISTQISAAKIKQAEARVASVQAQLNERTIRAPFSGVVSKMDVKVGEQAEAGKVVTGVISQGAYEVVVEVPESDVVGLLSGLPANITLDAYGADVIFPGTLESIDPAQTEVDGVSVYRAKVLFTDADERIRSGMTARVSIEKSRLDDVLSIPSRFIEKDADGEFVMKKIDDDSEKVYVVTGQKGSDGSVEIKSGLAEGDVVIGNFKP